MNLLLRSLIWVRRFRHRCGYGVHSPFAFNLLTGVVYEKGEFYAYAPLQELRRKSKGREKDDRLMLRLINDHRPDTCLSIHPESEATAYYLKAGCRSCRMMQATEWTPAIGNALQTWGKVGMLYLDHPQWAELLEKSLPHIDEHTLIVVKGIRHNKQSARAWQAWQERDPLRVTFDLHHFGLAYCWQRLNKQHYVVNYF